MAANAYGKTSSSCLLSVDDTLSSHTETECDATSTLITPHVSSKQSTSNNNNSKQICDLYLHISESDSSALSGNEQHSAITSPSTTSGGRRAGRTKSSASTSPARPHSNQQQPQQQQQRARTSSATQTSVSACFSIDSKPKFLKLFESARIAEGAVLFLACQAVGEPRPSIHWFKDNRLLKTTGRLNIVVSPSGASSLYIAHTQLYDAGVYQVTASNPHGISVFHAEIEIERKSLDPNCSWRSHILTEKKNINLQKSLFF